MKHAILAAILSGLLPFFPIQPASAQTAEPEHVPEHVTVRVTPEHQTAQGGETLWVAITQTIEPGWHTYWSNPGDSGIAPQVTWSLPDGILAGPLEYPAPHRIPYAGLMNFGYEGQVTMLQPLTLPQTLPEGPVRFEGQIEILVCHDICIPESKTVGFTINSGTGVDDTGLFAAARAMLPLPLEGMGTYTESGTDLLISIDSAALPDHALEGLTVLPLEWGILKNPSNTVIDSNDPGALRLRHERDYRELADITALPVLLAYNTPEGQYTAFSITLSPDGPVAATTAPAPIPAPVVETPPPEETLTLIQAILFALAGGIILNLMPCVFPILSIKALKLVQIQDHDHRIAILSGLTYTAGILLSFAVIGGALLALKAGGSQIGWGFQLQNPLVVLGLAYLLFIIGLSLSGLFEIGGSFANAGSSLAMKKGLTGTFFSGVLATLVATPCTAPFMAGALGYALVQPAPVAMGVFMALGLGLALPYLILCLVPALAKKLPRPGAWMVKVREFFAFPMYASAAWLVWVLSMQSGSGGVFLALTGMVAIAFCLWVVTHRPARTMGKIFLALLFIPAFLFVVLPFARPGLLQPQETTTAVGKAGTQPYTAASVAQALSGDDPVFIYMTAAWCITCKVNERIALDIPDTKTLFAAHKVRVFAGDWTNRNPEITAFLKTYGRSGVPLYVYIGPKDTATGLRPEPKVLPQILTPGLIASLFE